jgi:predicted transcriptional regulator
MAMRSKFTVRRSVWLSDNQVKMLKRLAKKMELNQAQIMRWALAEFASKNGEFRA